MHVISCMSLHKNKISCLEKIEEKPLGGSTVIENVSENTFEGINSLRLMRATNMFPLHCILSEIGRQLI